MRVHDNAAAITNNGNTISTTFETRTKPTTSFGTTWFKSMSTKICEWTFKIEKLTRDCMGIGICSNDTLFDTWFYYQRNDPAYALYYNGTKIRYNKRLYQKYAKIGFKQGSIVKMTVNFAKRSISYNIDGQDCGVAFDNIKHSDDIKYKMAVRIGARNDGVTLLSYTEIHLQNK